MTKIIIHHMHILQAARGLADQLRAEVSVKRREGRTGIRGQLLPMSCDDALVQLRIEQENINKYRQELAADSAELRKKQLAEIQEICADIGIAFHLEDKPTNG